MFKIKLTTSFPEWPLERQTPGSSGIWDNCQFFLNQRVDECDFWVVYEGLLRSEECYCPQENTVFITGEPPNVKTYNSRFLQNFGTILTFRKDIEHPNVIHTQPALPWHVGRRVREITNISFSKDYDELQSIKSYQNHKLLSVISSNKQFTEAHRRRIEFVINLKKHFKDNIDVFGRGLRDIDDKWTAIAPYKYHIVLENGAFSDYFSEKLSDAFLAGSYPFYYGAPNIKDYFSEKSFTAIDIQQPAQAFRLIENIINEGKYEKAISDILAARELVMNKYNIFPMLCELINNYSLRTLKTRITLKPEYYY